MSAAEPVMRRVRTVVGTAGIEQLSPDGARLVLRTLLFDGDGVPNWHRAASCADLDTDAFFPPAGADAGMHVQAAKRVCRGCPVRAACLADVMSWEQPSRRHGVAGGLSAAERHRLHREMRRHANRDQHELIGSAR